VGGLAELLDAELRAASVPESVRSVVGGLLQKLQSLFESPGGVANAIATLRGGAGAALALLRDALRPATDAPPASNRSAPPPAATAASGGIRQALDGAGRLAGMLPAQTLAGALRGVRAPVLNFVQAQVSDPGLSRLCGVGLGAVVDFAASALEAPANVAEAARSGLTTLVPALAGYLRDKLMAVFPPDLVTLRDAVGTTWDALLEQGLELLTRNDAMARLRDGGALRLLSRVLQGFFPVVRVPVVRTISYAPAQGLVARMFASIEDLVSHLAETTRTFNAGVRPALGLILPHLSRILRPFTEEVLVTPITHPGAQRFVRASLDGAYGLLENPDRLVAYKTMQAKDVGRELLTTLVPELLGLIENESLRSTLEGAARMALGALAP
jgi:hypothetical protein